MWRRQTFANWFGCSQADLRVIGQVASRRLDRGNASLAERRHARRGELGSHRPRVSVQDGTRVLAKCGGRVRRSEVLPAGLPGSSTFGALLTACTARCLPKHGPGASGGLRCFRCPGLRVSLTRRFCHHETTSLLLARVAKGVRWRISLAVAATNTRTQIGQPIEHTRTPPLPKSLRWALPHGFALALGQYPRLEGLDSRRFDASGIELIIGSFPIGYRARVDVCCHWRCRTGRLSVGIGAARSWPPGDRCLSREPTRWISDARV